jgi:hypothetical protein
VASYNLPTNFKKYSRIAWSFEGSPAPNEVPIPLEAVEPVGFTVVLAEDLKWSLGKPYP